MSKTGGQGATVLKITRDSVMKAVSLGMKPAEIVARLAATPITTFRQTSFEKSRMVQLGAPRQPRRKLTVLRCGDPTQPIES